MAKIPLTRRPASDEKAEKIRSVVRAAAFPAGAARRLARLEDAAAIYALIADRRVSDPIYTLPRPPTLEAARRFIERHLAETLRGEGLLILEFDADGAIAGYHDVQVWPQWAACELGGAIRPDLQSAGAGGAGAAAAFDWLFKVVGVDLICETAALGNIRTRKLLERIGFRQIAEIESELPDGGVRPSLYFEMTREEWDQRAFSTIG